MVKRIIKFFRYMPIKLRKKWNWLKAIHDVRFFEINLYAKLFFRTVFSLFICFALIFGCVGLVISFDTFHEYFNETTLFSPQILHRIKNSLQSIDFTTKENLLQDIVIAQISSTLLILSIVSFLASLDNMHCYGERAIEVLFPRSGLFSLKFLFFILIALMVANLSLLLKAAYSLWIVILFLSSLLVILYITLKITMIYISPEKLTDQILLNYYKENNRVVNRSKPMLRQYTSKKLEEFFAITAEYIETGNLKYKKNLDLYHYLINADLFNHKKQVQDYHTSIWGSGDLIEYLMGLIILLLKRGNIEEAVKQMNRLLHRLNFYKVILIDHYQLSNFMQMLWRNLGEFQTSHDFIRHESIIFELISRNLQQVYLYTVTDLSYCRLAKHDRLFFYPEANWLADYYEAIWNNKYLNEKEKQSVLEKCLFDHIRMIETYNPYAETNIDDFLEQKSTFRNTQEKSLYLLARPIALFFLKMHDENDTESFRSFLQMNLDKQIFAYVKILIVLSMENAVKRGAREYHLDIEVSAEQLEQYRKWIRLDKLNVNEKIIGTIGREIYKYNMEPYGDHGGTQRYVYHFHPQLTFSKEVFEKVFDELKSCYHFSI